MAKVCKQILCLVIYAIISLSSGENLEEARQNQIEDGRLDSKDTSRNARYISHQGPNSYYPNQGGYFYPNRNPGYDGFPVVNQYPGGTTQFYPDRYPNKLDPNYWLTKLPGFGGGYNPNIGYNPNTGYLPPSYPNYPGGGTNFLGFNPYPGRYPNSGYYPQSQYPTSGYPTTGYPAGNGGYGGYGGNGGLNSYSGYDGYYEHGNRPGNIGFGYHNGRIGPGGRYPTNLLPIATPATVSKDAK